MINPNFVADKIGNYLKVDISSRSRHRTVVTGRQYYYRYLRDHTLMSLNEMGQTLPLKQDHTTVINALNCFEANCIYKEYKRDWTIIKHILDNCYINEDHIVINAS